MRILVVEDYEPIRESIVQGMREADYAVDETHHGLEAIQLARAYHYDVIILDLMLPGTDGIDVVHQLRKTKNESCILILSARDQVEDRVSGLRAGADDYMIKPFVFEELLARVETLIRRKYSTSSPIIEVGDLVINTSQQTVRRGDQLIELTAREYTLLEYFAHRAGEVVSRNDIWAHVYDFPEDSQSNVVDVYVGYLRKKIEFENKPKLLRTRRGQGYVLGEQE